MSCLLQYCYIQCFSLLLYFLKLTTSYHYYLRHLINYKTSLPSSNIIPYVSKCGTIGDEFWEPWLLVQWIRDVEGMKSGGEISAPSAALNRSNQGMKYITLVQTRLHFLFFSGRRVFYQITINALHSPLIEMWLLLIGVAANGTRLNKYGYFLLLYLNRQLLNNKGLLD